MVFPFRLIIFLKAFISWPKATDEEKKQTATVLGEIPQKHLDFHH